jgi:hypothetical protein
MLMDIWNRMRITGVYADARVVVVRIGPMDEIKVKIIQLQVLEGSLAGGDHIFFSMFIIPQL